VRLPNGFPDLNLAVVSAIIPLTINHGIRVIVSQNVEEIEAVMVFGKLHHGPRTLDRAMGPNSGVFSSQKQVYPQRLRVMTAFIISISEQFEMFENVGAVR
jgi:hypothetical protein